MTTNSDSTLSWIATSSLESHPENPRLIMRQDVIDGIAAQLKEKGFHEKNALLVRPLGDKFQIIWGHHRKEGAEKAGLSEVPAWVEELSDEEAYMQLLLGNLQGELSPLEIGIHALSAVPESNGGRGQTGGLREYARSIGRDHSYLSELRRGAQVYKTVGLSPQFLERAKHLSEIHKAPEIAWRALCDALADGALNTVDDVQKAVARIKAVYDCAPEWWAAPLETYALIAIKEPAAAKRITGALEEARRVAETLTVVTAYDHAQTGEVEQREGRGFYRLDPVAREFDERGAFIERVTASEELPDMTRIQAIHRELISEVSRLSDRSVRYQPVLSDSEVQAEAERKKELDRLNEIEKYTPRLIQGDSLEQLKRLPAATVNLVCVDPPYNIDKADWDSFGSGQEFAEWAKPWLKECFRVLRDDGAIYVFGVNRMLSHIQHAMEQIGFTYRNWITWDTIQGAGGGLWVNRYEGILYFSKSATGTYEDSDSVKLERHEENVREYKGKEYNFKNPSNVWRFPCVDDKDGERTPHPTQKPVAVIERIVKASCPVDGLVLDPFMGSGTAGVAAMKNRRRSIGIERDSNYIEIARGRFEATEIGGA